MCGMVVCMVAWWCVCYHANWLLDMLVVLCPCYPLASCHGYIQLYQIGNHGYRVVQP